MDEILSQYYNSFGSSDSEPAILCIFIVTFCLLLAILFVWLYALILRPKNRPTRRVVGSVFVVALCLRILYMILGIVYFSTQSSTTLSIALLWFEDTSQFLFLAVFLLPICTNLQNLCGGPTKIVKTVNRVIIGILAVVLLLYLSLSSYSMGHGDWAYGLLAVYLYIFFLAVAEGTVLNIFAIKKISSNFDALRIWAFLTCFWLVFFSLTDVVQFTIYRLVAAREMTIDDFIPVAAILLLTGPLAAASMLGVVLDKRWALNDPYQTAYDPYRSPNDLDNTQPAHSPELAEHQELEAQEISQAIEHRDAFGRQFRVCGKNQNLDHFLRPYDGRLDLLRVQVFDSVALPTDRSVQWFRVNMNTKSTPLNKVLFWTWSSTQAKTGTQGKFNEYPYFGVVLKWIPSCIAMLFLFCIPQSIGGETRNGGFYDPVRDKDRYYSRAARNPYENNPQGERAQKLGLQVNPGECEPFLQHSRTDLDQCLPAIGEDEDNGAWGLASRPIRPRLLCFLNQETASPNTPEQSFEVRQGDAGNDEYIFISYTRKAFCVERRENPEWATRDRADLLRFAVTAAKAAAVPAFWIDFECVATDTATMPGQGNMDVSEDVYRICDVLRGAHSMVVINGPPYDNKQGQFTEKDRKAWLSVWASRLWVLPELLLAPAEHRIWLYTQESGVAPEDIVPERIPKRNLAWRSCADAEYVRQLVDHYEGTVQLSRLELVQLALYCLQRRGTRGRTNADLAYALKGLLRRRPATVAGESGFEAFASLSLANDSQRLLERLVCMLPPRPDVDWSDMRDAWGMKLWDIEPKCQVAGIVDDRTVLLDGAHGASIQWDRFETVAFMKRSTASRTVGRVLVRITPGLFIFGVLFVASSQGLDAPGTNPFVIIGAVILGISGLIILMAPYLLRLIYMGKFWSSQAWFFGIEGAVDDLAKIETALFGFNQNRLTWSTSGSLLSRHRINQFQECEAEAPQIKNNQSTGQSDENPNSRQQKIFTLIDTYSMTATMFYAYHPPTAVLICGQEGGMQRAVLCSYDLKTRAYCRETVLRMKTLVLERMFRADRFRFSLKRHYS